MKNKRKKAALLSAFAALFAAAGLSACGGGSNSDSAGTVTSIGGITASDSDVNSAGATIVSESASEAEHVHEWGEWTVTKEATCEEAGIKERVCAVCGEPETEEIPALGAHTYGEWTVTKEATCVEAGIKERVCAVCGEPETEEIPATGHTYKDGICTICGEKEPSEGLKYTLNYDNSSYSVTGIGSCTDTDIVIPSVYEGKPVTSIGKGAFYKCSGLTSIVIPESVTSIGSGAFAGSGLTSITVAEENKAYHIDGNCLIETLSKTLIAGNKNSVIPTDGSVTSIGEGAFYKCNGLTSIVIPDGVTSIGWRAFDGCNGLTSIVIPDSVASIGWSAFEECSGLTSIVIPDSVTNIEDWAFAYSGLTSIVIPDSVTSIGEYAFYNCSGLTSVTIGNELTGIGEGAFESCGGLTGIEFKGTMEEWKAITKDSNWNYNTGNFTITCTDGKLDKDGNKIE